jgi:predicted transcriptional regulator
MKKVVTVEMDEEMYERLARTAQARAATLGKDFVSKGFIIRECLADCFRREDEEAAAAANRKPRKPKGKQA